MNRSYHAMLGLLFLTMTPFSQAQWSLSFSWGPQSIAPQQPPHTRIYLHPNTSVVIQENTTQHPGTQGHLVYTHPGQMQPITQCTEHWNNSSVIRHCTTQIVPHHRRVAPSIIHRKSAITNAPPVKYGYPGLVFQ